LIHQLASTCKKTPLATPRQSYEAPEFGEGYIAAFLKATTALPLLENLSGQYNSPDSLLPRLARVNQGINDKGLRLPFISRTRHIPQYEGVRIGKRVQQDESPQKSALVRRQYHDAIGVMGTPGFGLMGIAAWPSTRYQKKTKAQEARAEIRADVEKQIKALASKRAAAQANILELRQHTEDHGRRKIPGRI